MQLKRCYHVRPMGAAEVERTQVIYKTDKKTGHQVSEIIQKKIHYPETFMVFFPRGHSLRVLSRERLNEMNLQENAQVVDMDTGLPPPQSLESLSDFAPIHGTVSSGDPFADAMGDQLRG